MILDKSINLFFLILFLSAPLLYTQSITAGAELGGGVISSNSPTVGSFSSSLFIEGGITTEDYLGLRVSLLYARDFSILLPDDRSDYYPFIKCAELKLIHASDLTNRIYFEQGLGILMLNDRIYSDRNSWGYGLAVSLLAGKDMRSSEHSGFKIGIGTEYGLTFIEFSAYYLTVFAQISYTF